MVIDFHTHIYPDKIAARTIEALGKAAPGVCAHTDGTLGGLLESMDRSGIDRSVILPVATRKGQFDTINGFALKLNNEQTRLISFGGIHPDDDEPFEKLSWLKENGFKGIKIHPDYTGTFIDDPRYINIITICTVLGLKVVTHAGVDPAFDVIHCPPQKGRAVLEAVSASTGVKEPFLIFAHLGGMCVHSEVEKYLLGSNCYLDISCAFPDLLKFCDTTDDDVVKVVKKHGADRILFGTDSPWTDQQAAIGHFRALKGLTEKEKDLILFQNAQKLLD